jgi:hypothetical protein
MNGVDDAREALSERGSYWLKEDLRLREYSAPIGFEPYREEGRQMKEEGILYTK